MRQDTPPTPPPLHDIQMYIFNIGSPKIWDLLKKKKKKKQPPVSGSFL